MQKSKPLAANERPFIKINAELSGDVRRSLWEKFVVLVAMSGATTTMRQTIGPIRSNPLTRAYAEKRARWEPLLEVSQSKGDNETHPFLSPDDEFANFERWDWGNLGTPVTPKQPEMFPFEHARSALKLGLQQEAKLGVNPSSLSTQAGRA